MGFVLDFFSSLIYEAVAIIIDLFVIVGTSVYYLEEMIWTDVLPAEKVSTMYTFMSALAITFVLLKILQKGFMTYILQRDGDPDAPVETSVVNLFLSVAVIISFPTFYSWFVEVSIWIIENVMYAANDITDETIWLDATQSIVSGGLLYVIIFLVYLICLFVLYLQFLKRSAELFVLRLGFPLACLGLLDSDNGVFNTTVKIFIQVTLTTAAQMFFMCFSAALMVKSIGAEMFTAIACIMAAFSTPRLMQQILLPVGGGNAMYKASSVMHMAGMLKGLAK